MRLVPLTSHDCDAVREQLSRALDEELTEHERARLELHLDGCSACRAFQAETEVIAHTLRAMPLEQPDFAVILPRHRRIPVRTLQAGVAAAAVALVASLASVHALGGSRATVTPFRVAPHAVLDRRDEVVPHRFRPSNNPVGSARIAL